MFPEIDITSKMGDTLDYIVPQASRYESFLAWVSHLYNVGSAEIRRELASSRFYVRLSDWDVERKRPIIITMRETDSRLNRSGFDI